MSQYLLCKGARKTTMMAILQSDSDGAIATLCSAAHDATTLNCNSSIDVGLQLSLFSTVLYSLIALLRMTNTYGKMAML